MLRSNLLFKIFLITIIFSFEFIQARFEDDEELQYTVGLSEPLKSTLEWDYDPYDETKLIFRWNITLKTGSSGILAFSNRDLNTNNLDVILFGSDEKIYNAYTNENSLLFIPDDNSRLSYSILKSVSVENKIKKQYSIRIIRPLNTCEKLKRNYIIDSGTTHLLTGSLSQTDFQKLRAKVMVKMDVERMNLTLQRVQLLKSRVRLSTELYINNYFIF